MAKKRKNDDSDDDLSVETFGPSPEDHPDAKAFAGYLRQAPDKTSWRLFLSLDFNDYLEIPKDALIGQQTLSNRTNPLAGDVVWIRGGATLRRVSISVREGQAEFLRGDIVAQNLSRAAMGIPTLIQQPTTVFSDPTMCRACLSQGGTGCPVATQGGGCNRPTQNCPSAVC